jgi:hypothetical protein
VTVGVPATSDEAPVLLAIGEDAYLPEAPAGPEDRH